MAKVAEIVKRVAGGQPAPQPVKLPMEILQERILDRASTQLKTLQGEQKSRIEDALEAFKVGIDVMAAEMGICEKNRHQNMMATITRSAKGFKDAIDRARQEGKFGELRPAEEIAQKYVAAVKPSPQPVNFKQPPEDNNVEAIARRVAPVTEDADKKLEAKKRAAG